MALHCTSASHTPSLALTYVRTCARQFLFAVAARVDVGVCVLSLLSIYLSLPRPLRLVMAQQSITSFFSGASAGAHISTSYSPSESQAVGLCLPSRSDAESDGSKVQLERSGRPDIGTVLKHGMSVEEVNLAVAALSRGQKYELLFRHISPPAVLPATHSHGCNRRFNPKWLKKYSWLVYSPTCDGIFCGACALLCSKQQ